MQKKFEFEAAKMEIQHLFMAISKSEKLSPKSDCWCEKMRDVNGSNKVSPPETGLW